MNRCFRALLAHRLALLFCGGALLAGSAAAISSAQQLAAAEATLARLRQELARKTQQLAELGPATAALDGLIATDPAAPETLAGVAAARGLTFEAEPAADMTADQWQQRSFRLQGQLLHEQILLDVLEHWHKRSVFQHQLRRCHLQRQAAKILADCQLVLFLPAAP